MDNFQAQEIIDLIKQVNENYLELITLLQGMSQFLAFIFVIIIIVLAWKIVGIILNTIF